MPIFLIYGLWSKKEIEKFIYRSVRISPKSTVPVTTEKSDDDDDDVFAADDKPKSEGSGDSFL